MKPITKYAILAAILFSGVAAANHPARAGPLGRGRLRCDDMARRRVAGRAGAHRRPARLHRPVFGGRADAIPVGRVLATT